MKKIIENLKYVKLKDIFSIFVLILAFPFAMILKVRNKMKKRELWLICEAENTARDNGYHLFKYMREKHPEEYCFYAISKKCSDYKKIEKYGNIIQFSGFQHWIFYLAANKNISTQKAGNPNASLFYVLQTYGMLRNKRVFLQHGVIKDKLPYVNYRNAKFRLFICGAKKEYEFVRDTFGYPKGYVKYTGLARFDNLHHNQVNKKQILVMPTWRNWLGRDLNSITKQSDFTQTPYFKHWNSFLQSQELNHFLEENSIQLFFYPHIHMQKYLHYFEMEGKNIKVVDNTDIDIQELLKNSALLITDYSSVFMDFAYMKKPIIHYQFDKKEFREKHLEEGYFKYERDGFGNILEQEDEVIKKIEEYIRNDYQVEEIYQKRMEEFFELHDTKNCQRIYEEIKRI